ncbi:MAG: putative Ig domain-containing protein [Acidobacteria bacterium]|nr:putative Ig domain-containing protein [Acidobacteriota bacterium]
MFSTTLRCTISLAILLVCSLALAVAVWAQVERTRYQVTAAPKPNEQQHRQQELEAKLERKLEKKRRQQEWRSSPDRFDEPAGAAGYFLTKRLATGMKDLPLERYASARAQMARMRQYSTALGKYLDGTPGQLALGNWTSLGPGNIGGRTRALLINPADANTMYAAGVAGGIWKTTNGGNSWTPMSDLLANIAINSMAMDPTNSNVIYAGTGEGFFNVDSVRGNGIFKTTDGGTNWTHLPPTASNSNFHYVNDLVVSATNSQRIYAATRTGIFRSLDGGANWTQVFAAPQLGGCLDLAIRTDQANDYVFAACGNFAQATIYRNTDAGSSGTWDAVHTEANMGRTSLAIAPSNQNVIYALSASLAAGNYDDGLHAVFRSTTGGAAGSWSARVTNTNPTKLNTLLLTNVIYAHLTECGFGTSQYFNQGWYDNVIAVDPADENRVWAGGVDIFRSDDGGANWGYVPCGIHPDHHTIVFHPQYNGTSNKTMFVGNDGGIYRTTDARAPVRTSSVLCSGSCTGLVTFSKLNNNYGVTQFYHGVPYPNGQTYFGGTQDNGTNRGSEAGGASWSTVLGGDGGYVAVDPTNTNTLYAENFGLSIQRSTNGGNSWANAVSGITNSGFLFITPFIMDPSNAQRLWTGGSVLWRTSNGASSWTQASAALSGGSVSAISVAPTDANNVLAGTSTGFVHRTTTGTTSTSATSWPSVQPRSGYVSWIAHDPANASVVYATYSTFGGTHVWKSTNGGASWSGLDGTSPNNIPDVPVHCLAVDPANTSRLYVGTDVGVFASTDGGLTWAVENSGFANVITESLSLNTTGSTRFLFAFTHGRGAWRVPLSGSGAAPTISGVSPAVAAVGSTLTLQGSGFVGVNGVKFSNNINAAFTIYSDTQISVTVPAGAQSGPLTVSKPSFPDVQGGNLTVCPTPPVTLSVDDNSAETSLGFGTGPTNSVCVNRLTPSSYPATLTAVLPNIALPAGTNINIVVGVNADGDSNINNTITQTIATTVAASNAFTYYAVTPITINAGDFVVGFSYVPSAGVFPANLDQTTTQTRSYLSTNGTSFSTLDSQGYPGNLLVRAEVFPGTCPNCTYAIAPGSQSFTAAGGSNSISVTAGSGCDWTAVSQAPWISITSGASGTGNGSVSYSVAANPGLARNGTITVAGYSFSISQSSGCGLIGATPTTLPAGIVGSPYNQTINGTGGTASYSFALAVGSALPSGLSLASNGTLSGTPMAAGSFSFSVNITDANGCTGSATLSLNVTCPAITVSPTSLPNGTVGSNYNQSLSASGGTAAYTFSFSGNLPTGLSLTPGGTLSGTPTAAGSFTFTVTATDSKNCTGSRQYTVVIACPAISVGPATMANGTSGIPYSQSFSQSGATAAVVWTLTGPLPTGLSLDLNTGVLAGTTTQQGSFSITVRATDSNGCFGEQSYTLVIGSCPTITISPMNISAKTVGVAFSQQLSASGGSPAHSFAVTAGSLPNGVTLSASGLLEGTATQVGNFVFTVTATDSIGCAGSRQYTLTINCPTITVSPTTISTGTVGSFYTQSFTQAGAIGALTWSVTGALPTGLSFAHQTQTISGTPIQPGSFPISVTVTDGNNCQGTRSYTLVIDYQTIALSPESLPNGQIGAPYTAQLAQSGGAGTITWSHTGNLPNGVLLNTGSGLLSGAATASGTFNFTVRATDQNGCFAERSYSVIINPCPEILLTPATLPGGTVGTTYNQSLSATGGTPGYTFSLDSGTLPTNVMLSPSGTLSGQPNTAGSFTFTVKVTDQNNCQATRQYTVVICGTITVNPASLANGFVGTAYSQSFTQTGGVGAIIWSSSGALPGGLSLNPSSGLLSGLPTTTGTYAFSIRATDQNGCFGERSYGVTISGSGLQFYPLSRPIRLLDTRANQGNCDNVSAPIAAGTFITTQARTTCEGIPIPTAAQAVVGNITVINQSPQAGYLVLYPDGVTQPLAANMIYEPGQILANNFTVGLSADGKFNIFGERTIDVIVDISGYFAPPASGGLYYHPLAKPIRLLDTRDGQGNCDIVAAPILAGTSLTTLARTTCEGLTIPASAQAIVGNATVINGSGQTGYLTIYPDGVTAPLAANMVYFPGSILSNAFTVALSNDGKFNIFGEKTIDMVVDIAGYYSTEPSDVNGAGLLFNPLPRPLRILDTRAAQGNCDSVNAPITGGSSLAAAGRLTCESLTIPNDAQTVLGNVTIINQSGQTGFLTLYPDGQAQPLAANLVYFPGKVLSNAFVVGLNANTGQYRIFAERTLEAIVDVSGYFAP